MTARQRFVPDTPTPASQPPRLRDALREAWIRVRTRRALTQLTSEELKDVGLSRCDALQELSLPLWKIVREALRGR